MLIFAITLIPTAACKAATDADSDLGFAAAFPRPFYQKKYFGLAVTGAAIVAAGAVTYVTAGGGAPAAATGVSTVASWVAGGGAGSYMAGLSTIGGWFGGNAILGAAILNGISLGTVGGSAAFSTLSVGQKALVMTSIAATALDGVALVSNPKTADLDWSVTLPVPRSLADSRLRSLIDDLSDTNEALAKLGMKSLHLGQGDEKGSRKVEALTAQEMKHQRDHEEKLARRRTIDSQIEGEIKRAIAEGDTKRNLVVLAVLAHNLGKRQEFRELLERIRPAELSDSSYFDYLGAVAAIQARDEPKAEALLNSSWNSAKFAIEPPILLVNLLGRKDFALQEARISEITERADKHFSADAYAPRTSLVALHFRIGAQALKAKNCDRAMQAFEKANKAFSIIQKYVTGADIRNLLDVGKANALHCQGKTTEADDLFRAARKRAKAEERELLCVQYSRGCPS